MSGGPRCGRAGNSTASDYNCRWRKKVTRDGQETVRGAGVSETQTEPCVGVVKCGQGDVDTSDP